MDNLLNSLTGAYHALQDLNQRQSQDAENGSRPATAVFSTAANGAGTVVMQKPLLFSNYFLEQPTPSYSTTLGSQLDPTKFNPPQCDGGVYSYISAPMSSVFGAGTNGLPDISSLLSQGPPAATDGSVPTVQTTSDGYQLTPATGGPAKTVYLGVFIYMRVRLFNAAGRELTFAADIPKNLSVNFNFTFTGMAMKMLDRDNVHGPLANDSQLATLTPPVMAIATGL